MTFLVSHLPLIEDQPRAAATGAIAPNAKHKPWFPTYILSLCR